MSYVKRRESLSCASKIKSQANADGDRPTLEPQLHPIRALTPY